MCMQELQVCNSRPDLRWLMVWLLGARRERRLQAADRFRTTRRLVDQDVTVVGEELTRLPEETLTTVLEWETAGAAATHRRVTGTSTAGTRRTPPHTSSRPAPAPVSAARTAPADCGTG